MKKVFAILLVLAVVAGFVFAADPVTNPITTGQSETHNIKVKADVAPIIPIFQLTDGTNVSNTTNEFENGKIYPTNTAANAKYVGFSLDEDGSFVVTANVLQGKIKQSFTLKFSGGDFAVRKNGAAATHSPESITTAALIAAPTEENTYVGVYSTVPTGNDETNKVVTVVFDGKKVSTTTAVATATFAYKGDDTIDATDPDDSDDWYYADIAMLVTAL